MGDILTMTSDNSAVVSCKSNLALLDREGWQDLQKIGSHDFFSEYSELESNINRVQAIKKSSLRRFWKVAGRELVREVAQRGLEEVNFVK